MAKIIPNQNTYVGFIPTLTGTVSGGPKVADVTTATDLTSFLTSINASASGNAVPTPAFDSLFETSIIGTSQATFTADFYRDDLTDTAWTTLPRGTTGFFIITRYGGKPSTAGKKCELWPVQVLSRTMANMSNNTVETFTITCSVPQTPNEDSTVQT